MTALQILKGNADLVPYIFSVPCDVCSTSTNKTEADANASVWQRGVCDRCADDLREANPEWPQIVSAVEGQ